MIRKPTTIFCTIFSLLAYSAEVASNEEKRYAEKSHKKYTLLKSSRNKIRMKFNDLLKTSQPNVLIFASCFSHESEINDILRSDGLLSALTVAAERGGITCGKVFKLDPEQQTFLKMIAENSTLKTVVLMGKQTCSLKGCNKII